MLLGIVISKFLDKFKNATQIDLTLCAQIKDNSIVKLSNTEKLLYSYLPTEETNYNLPILANASFLTTANRESLHTDSIWNQWLFEQIGTKLFEWIAELVQSEYQFQAYNLLPNKIKSDSLGNSFNKAIDMALDLISFVVTNTGDLVKVKDSIVDFTFLSEKGYVGEKSIKKLLDANEKYFTANTGFGNKLIELGAIEFNWKQVVNLFSSTCFQEYCSPENNINLIEHLFSLAKQEKFNGLKKEDFKNIPFILDHKNGLCIPERVCFPSADNLDWNDPSINLSFIHKDIQEWLRQNPDIKDWLESLGVLEKTDITYITQTIIPNIQSYITHSNAIQAIQDLFLLYEKGELKKELIEQLSEIKLLTKKGQLVSANQCHLSDFYSPRFAIEELLDLDIFVSEKYCIDIKDKNEWKHFFIMLGVEEKTSIVNYSVTKSKDRYIEDGYQSDYFNSDENKFQPYITSFRANEFSGITTIKYIEHVKNSLSFSFKFWKDFLENNLIDSVNNQARAYWGHIGRAGRNTGNQVTNYIPWYIKNVACIPTTTGNCYSAVDVFLNLPEIKEIGGSYLPIFDGIELNADWRAFFKFKTEFDLEDYLSVLTQVSRDTELDGKVKKTNIKRINLIYRDLLNECSNWGENEISVVQEWSKSNQLLNSENKFTACNELKYFLDGNESIFQGQFNFINISAENKQHRAIEKLLKYLGIYILKQNSFELIPTSESYCLELKEHLEHILPYFKIWIEQDINDPETLRALEDLQSNISELSIKHALELKIQYPEIGFIKDTNTYFHKTEIYVTKPWDSNSVLMTLPTQLCGFLGLRGHDKKLDFLLRANIEEIQKYFSQENINVPEEILNKYISKTPNLTSQTITSISGTKTSLATYKKVSSEYFHMSEADLEKYQYTQEIISRAMKNILQYLSTHNDYDCTNHYQMASSILGGIKKNGHEITIVARPSDNNQVILYEGSEFDVLSHADAEFWHEDGKTPPRQIRIGQLITQLGINRIPIRNINISTDDLISSLKAKSQILDFDVIPFVPEKMAKIIAAFANTDGGKIIFGVKESSLDSIEVVGLSKSIDVVDIVQKAIVILSPIPSINYEWVHVEGKNIFLIEVEKQNAQDVLLSDMKYIRDGIDSILEKEKVMKTWG
nr:ATP-binding protein [Wohlfahrtiimonas chitiniclastica]